MPPYKRGPPRDFRGGKGRIGIARFISPRLGEDQRGLGATQQASRRRGGRSGQGQLYSMPARGWRRSCSQRRSISGQVRQVQPALVAQLHEPAVSYTQTLNERGLSVSRVFPKGTIVLTIAANIGDTGILDFDSAFPDSLVGIIPRGCLSNEYLALYLRTQKDEMDRLAPRGTQKNINIRFLEPWPVPIPPPTEQAEITKCLLATERKLKAEAHRRESLGELFKTLLHHLMTGKLRVKDLNLPSPRHGGIAIG
jgi:Type I restriction modification DNA specificity domain